MDDGNDFAKEIGTRSLFCYARTRVNIYEHLRRLNTQCRRKHHRDLTKQERSEIYAAIRYYRKSHGLNIKTGRPLKYERLEGDDTYDQQ